MPTKGTKQIRMGKVNRFQDSLKQKVKRLETNYTRTDYLQGQIDSLKFTINYMSEWFDMKEGK